MEIKVFCFRCPAKPRHLICNVPLLTTAVCDEPSVTSPTTACGFSELEAVVEVNTIIPSSTSAMARVNIVIKMHPIEDILWLSRLDQECP